MLGKQFKIEDNLYGDTWIWVIMLLLALSSVVAMFSMAGTLQGTANFNAGLFLKHSFHLAAGFAVAYALHQNHYFNYSLYSRIFIWIAVAALLYTLIMGVEINGARRWLRVPLLNVTIQTSDFARIALIVFLARWISIKQPVIKKLKEGILGPMLLIILVCGLIAPENLSTAFLLFVIGFSMLFIGRASMKHLTLMVFLGVLMGGVFYGVGKALPDSTRLSTWLTRMEDFFKEKEDHYHVKLQKIAIVEGGFFGVGGGQSHQKSRVPLAHADSIFAIILAEYGLVGGLFLILLYLLLLYRGFVIVYRSPKTFGALVVIGLILNIVLTAFANMAVAVNLIPVTGQTLPWISAGGTSIIFTGISFGIIQSVSKYIQSTEENLIEQENKILDLDGKIES
jgi:cell division protein FtsW